MGKLWQIKREQLDKLEIVLHINHTITSIIILQLATQRLVIHSYIAHIGWDLYICRCRITFSIFGLSLSQQGGCSGLASQLAFFFFSLNLPEITPRAMSAIALSPTGKTSISTSALEHSWTGTYGSYLHCREWRSRRISYETATDGQLEV